MIDLQDYAKAKLKSIRYKGAPTVSEQLKLDESIIECYEKELEPDFGFVHITNISLYKYNQNGANTETIKDISEYFGIEPIELFCSYEINGGSFADLVKPFPKVKGVFIIGGVALTKKSIITHPGGMSMERKPKSKAEESKRERIISNTIIAGLCPDLE